MDQQSGKNKNGLSNQNKRGVSGQGWKQNKKVFGRKCGSAAKELTYKQKGIMRHYHRILKKEQRKAGNNTDGGDSCPTM